MLTRDNNIGFVFIIASLMALVSLTINMLLPAYSNINDTFKPSSPDKVHSVVSLLYLGLAIGQMLYGPLSDTTGRKKAMYIGLFLFIIGCLQSLFSSSLNELIIGQIIQGLGLGAPRVLVLSIVRDQYEGNKMAKIMSYVMMIYILVPVISPTLGKSLLLIMNWKWLYLFFIVLTLIVLIVFAFKMPETLQKPNRVFFSITRILKAAIIIIKNKESCGFIFILGLYSSVFIGILNLSQKIFEFDYNLGNKYTLYFALLALSIGLASFFNGRWVDRYSMKSLVHKSIYISIIASVFHLIYSLKYAQGEQIGLNVFFGVLLIQFFCYGILIGNISALALKPLGHVAGLASSLVGAISTIISVPVSLLIGYYYLKYNNNTLPVSFLLAGSFSLIIIKTINKYEK
ncbi:MFS transporter [Flavivirga sp. 57AJ16]|uniref:MFS transporter n=1 Tax=Flavivirga sp. 57AJ16 TaxID=3025307 RepID=UPI002366E6E7|nr:MFS transporter [Flavivirga sp. 57AJ16]MDD7886187.1 MFS transporter [Flavivirga sp. 57AJ16]